MPFQRTALRVLALACALAVLTCSTAFAAAPVAGVSFDTIDYRGTRIDVVAIDLRKAQLVLYWKDAEKRLGTLYAVRDLITAGGANPVAVTNAGIFAETVPVGLHIERRKTLHKISLGTRGGNFFMLPNGVFFVDERGAGVLETRAFLAHAKQHRIELATQSGPLLLQKSSIHPKFAPQSQNSLVRSGIGVRSPDQVVIAVTRDAIRFFDFATFFRDRVSCPDALYLDGVISRLWAPPLGLDSDGGEFMGMLAVSAGKGLNKAP